MSTHNIGFYEDLIKLSLNLSSNIIKYAPYFFCCNLKYGKVPTCTHNLYFKQKYEKISHHDNMSV